jgi:carbon-monoxide dehydrogenase small subunit
VLVNGDIMFACITPALFVDNTSVTTIEGLSPEGGPLTPLQDAFIRHGGFQCGICTPGQIMAATALLADNPHPTEREIKEWMMGNLCRCTGYYKIVESILAAADTMSGVGGQGSGARGLSASITSDPQPLTPDPAREGLR